MPEADHADADLPAPPPGMPREVADQIVKDLDEGPKILSSLATAAHLIAVARGGEAGLRLAESAAYNLREALDAVVASQAAGKGGIPAIRDALGRYRVASSDPETSEDAALRSLADDLLRLESDGELLGFRSRQFLAWLEARTGIKPLPGADNPSNQFTALRDDVNKVLHDAGALPAVAGYYDDAINWFTRMFTPPDNRVHAIVDLARTPFTGPAQIAALRGRIAYNAHHLVRFLSEVRDPAWLDALLEDGLIGPPRDGEPWPVAALIGGAGGIAPTHVIALFQRIRAQAARGDRDQFSALDRELMELSFRLGPDPAAQALAVTIVHKRASDHWVQTIGVFLAGDADPSSPIQAAIADAVIANDTTTDGRYKTRTMSKLLVDGLNEENARERLSLLAHKLAKLAAEPRVKYFPPSTAALNTPERSGDRPDELAIVAQSLTSAIPVSRDLGLSTSDILELVAPIGGKVGARVICQVLAGAPDASREMKLAHLRTRLASSTATGDDRDLLADLGELGPEEADQLSAELGQPSPQPDPDERGFLDIPRDWRRAWGWSTVLPPQVLGRWDQAIAVVTERHGPPDDDALDRRLPASIASRPDSPYTTEQLSELPPIEAAELVAAWRTGPDTTVWGTSIYELASELEATIAADVNGWTTDPVGIITALREPAYIQRYLRVLERNAKDLVDTIGPVMESVALIRTEPWTPAQLTRNEIDLDFAWSGLDRPIVQMIAAFANAEADFGAHLDMAWDITNQLVRDLPAELPPLLDSHDPEAHDDAYGRAINRTYGQALATAVSLGWLGNRRDSATPARFTDILDWVLTVPGSVGAELRSVVAALRPVLEHSAKDWLDQRHRDLFGGELGEITFEATLKYPRSPTPWLYANYRARIAKAALAGVPTAVALPLLGYLWEVDGFTIRSILGSYKGNTKVLRETAEEIASLVQNLKADDPMLARALAFWDGMLDGAGPLVPKAALAGAGRWAFVSAVPTEDLLHRLDRTTELTGGDIDLAIEVADRCRDAQPDQRGLRILSRMQGHGERWEVDHSGRVGLQALAAAAGHGITTEFARLRDRLIELGFHDAVSIHDEPS